MFSTRVPADLAANRLAASMATLRAAGGAFIDLTLSNPTRAGFDYPPDLLNPLAGASGLQYDPSPFGALEARRAVAADYARRGLEVDPARIALTASTSEAYSLLFKLLADAGDTVLVPRPSYPLFEHLARLDLVTPRPYDLDYDSAWTIDFGSLESALDDRTRAVLVVSPNNPTGSFVSRADLDRLSALCARRGIAVIADEVFADYELEPGVRAAAGSAAAPGSALTFALGGLSKSIGLPQVKLGWMAVTGPDALVAAALDRLELVCDTYLSVSTPVQVAAPRLLERGAAIRAQIATRVAANYREAQCLVSRVSSCRLLRSDGGWSAVLQVPTLAREEDLVIHLLTARGVLAHPGYFFDFPRESFLVVSLLPPPADFSEGLQRVLRHFDCSVAAS